MRIVRVYAVTYELHSPTGNDVPVTIHSANVEIADWVEDSQITAEIETMLFMQLGHDNYEILSYCYMSDKGY